MLLHHHPFGGGELTSLLQDLIWNLDLAEIMQITTALKSDDIFIVEAEMTPQFTGIMCQPGATVASKRIAGFHAKSQSKKNRLGVLQLIGEVFKLQQTFDPGVEFFWIKRL